MLKAKGVSQKYILVATLCALCYSSVLASGQDAQPAQPATASPAVQSPIDTRISSTSSTSPALQAAPQEASPAVPLGSAPTLDSPGVKDLGGGGWFTDKVSWLRWGPVSVRSADVLYTYSQYGSPSQTLSGTLFRTNIAYDKQIGRSRLVLQYNPSLLSANGQFSTALTNENTSFDMLFTPTAHLSIGVSDLFEYHGGQNNLVDRNLDRSSFIGALINPFLNNGRESLVNVVSVPVSYQVSARTNFSVSPFAGYTRASINNDVAGTQGPDIFDSAFQFGARTQINHTVSQNQSIGLFYSYQEVKERGLAETSYFNSFGASASRRIGRSFVFSAEAGGSYLSETAKRGWTGVGSASLTKLFRRGSLQGTYGRDTTFTGLLGHGYSQYTWLNYTRQFGLKTHLTSGFGYLSGPTLSHSSQGKYVNSSIDYALAGNLACFVGYVHFWQVAGGPQFLPGDQSQIQVGLRWSARRRPEY